jgi:hypothetical protein
MYLVVSEASDWQEEEGVANADRPEESSDPRFQELCAQVRADMERLHVPGVVVGVLNEGKEQIAGFGVTNVDPPSPRPLSAPWSCALWRRDNWIWTPPCGATCPT